MCREKSIFAFTTQWSTGSSAAVMHCCLNIDHSLHSLGSLADYFNIFTHEITCWRRCVWNCKHFIHYILIHSSMYAGRFKFFEDFFQFRKIHEFSCLQFHIHIISRSSISFSIRENSNYQLLNGSVKIRLNFYSFLRNEMHTKFTSVAVYTYVFNRGAKTNLRVISWKVFSRLSALRDSSDRSRFI